MSDEEYYIEPNIRKRSRKKHKVEKDSDPEKSDPESDFESSKLKNLKNATPDQESGITKILKKNRTMIIVLAIIIVLIIFILVWLMTKKEQEQEAREPPREPPERGIAAPGGPQGGPGLRPEQVRQEPGGKPNIPMPGSGTGVKPNIGGLKPILRTPNVPAKPPVQKKVGFDAHESIVNTVSETELDEYITQDDIELNNFMNKENTKITPIPDSGVVSIQDPEPTTVKKEEPISGLGIPDKLEEDF